MPHSLNLKHKQPHPHPRFLCSFSHSSLPLLWFPSLLCLPSSTIASRSRFSPSPSAPYADAYINTVQASTRIDCYLNSVIVSSIQWLKHMIMKFRRKQKGKRTRKKSGSGVSARKRRDLNAAESELVERHPALPVGGNGGGRHQRRPDGIKMIPTKASGSGDGFPFSRIWKFLIEWSLR